MPIGSWNLPRQDYLCIMVRSWHILWLVALVFTASCKGKLDKKDISLEEMQAGDGGQYTPVLPDADLTPVFKSVNGKDLHLNVYLPEGHRPGDLNTCLVFFFGGGFINGNPAQFQEQCRYFSALGYVAITADYRVISRDDCTAVECVLDGKSAIRYIRSHADELGIDTNKVIAGGGSAGAGLALMCAIDNPGFNEAGDNTAVSCVPDGLLLFNPVVDMEEHPFRIRKFDGHAEALSPVKHIDRQLPPTLLFHGTADEIAGYDRVVAFEELAKGKGTDITLKSYEGMEHGFYQRNKHDGKYYEETLQIATDWLRERGW